MAVTDRILIPQFIATKYPRRSGRFHAGALFVDIAGFTAMTGRFAELGRVGAEMVTDIINRVYEPSIQTINQLGGFVASFAGDAFTALFPGDRGGGAAHAARMIRSILSKLMITTPFGRVRLAVRVGVAAGFVNWRVIPSPSQWAFYFRGPAINRAARAEHSCRPGEIAFGSDLKPGGSDRATNIPPAPIPDDLTRRFIPEAILELGDVGEFRDIVSMFVSFGQIRRLSRFIGNAIEIANEFGGYFNKVDFGDKGGIILILFGAPIGQERLNERALECALSLKRLEPKIRVGLAAGLAYTGFIGSRLRSEYTAIGNVVNLSARLALKAKWGEVYCDVRTSRSIGFRFESAGAHRLKGFSQKVPISRMIGRGTIKERLFPGKMVGRDQEFSKLRKLISPIDKGKFAGVIYVDGPAGIGKSRLVSRLKMSLSREKYTWFYLPCDGILRESLNPVVYFLKNYFAQKAEDSDRANRKRFEIRFDRLLRGVKDPDLKKELIRTRSILGALINLRWRNSLYERLDARGRYENLLYAFKNLVKAECLQHPLVIELEDGHWVDSDTVELLRVLTRNVEDYPFVIITSCRMRDDGTRFQLQLTGIPEHRIHLGNLNESSVRELAEDRWGGKLSDRLFNLIWTKSEGVPFYIEQIILYLKESGKVMLKGGVYELTGREIEIPGKITRIIIARIDRLEKKLRDVIKTASVLGREFSIRVLSGMLRGEPVDYEVKRGEQEGIWTPLSELFYIFKHALIRDAVYGMQLKKRLRALHLLAAETMVDLYQNEMEAHYGQIAYHYESAGIRDKAREFLFKAGDYAKERYKNDEALKHYRNLLKYVSGQGRVEVHKRMVEVLHHIGRWKEAERLLRRNLRAVARMGDMRAVAQCKNRLAKLLCAKGNYREALRLAEDARAVFSRISELHGVGECLSNLGDIYIQLSEFDSARACLTQALKIFTRVRDRVNICKTIGNMGILHHLKGEEEEALKCYRRVLTLAQKIGARRIFNIAVGNMGNVFRGLKRYDQAMASYRQQLKTAMELGDRLVISHATGNLGILHSELGKYEQAIEYYQKQLEIARELGDQAGISRALGNMGMDYASMGEFLKAERCYQQSLKIAERYGIQQIVCIALSYLGDLYRRGGDYRLARKCYDRAIQIARSLKIDYHLCDFLYRRVELDFRLGKKVKIGDLRRQILPIACRCGRQDIAFEVEVLMARVKARLSPKHALTMLTRMLERSKGDYKLAVLYYEIFQITGARKHRIKALRAYRRLYRNNPDVKYRDRIEELTQIDVRSS